MILRSQRVMQTASLQVVSSRQPSDLCSIHRNICILSRRPGFLRHSTGIFSQTSPHEIKNPALNSSRRVLFFAPHYHALPFPCHGFRCRTDRSGIACHYELATGASQPENQMIAMLPLNAFQCILEFPPVRILLFLCIAAAAKFFVCPSNFSSSARKKMS